MSEICKKRFTTHLTVHRSESSQLASHGMVRVRSRVSIWPSLVRLITEQGRTDRARYGAEYATTSLASRTRRRNKMQKITPFLWFDDKAEGAMNFYVSV